MIRSPDGRMFQREFIYLKFQSNYGAYGQMKAVFPNQTKQDVHLQELREAEDEAGVTLKSKSKMQQNIQFQIYKLIAEPQMYERFLLECDQLEKKHKERVFADRLKQSQSLSKTAQVVDHIKQNRQEARLASEL